MEIEIRSDGQGMDRCAAVRESLCEWQDNELDPALRPALEAHLYACPDCAQEAELLRSAAEAIRHLPREVAPGSIMASFRGQAGAASPRSLKPSFHRWHRATLSAAALVLIGVVVFVAVGPHRDRLQGHTLDGGSERLAGTAPPAEVGPRAVPERDPKRDELASKRKEIPPAIAPRGEPAAPAASASPPGQVPAASPRRNKLSNGAGLERPVSPAGDEGADGIAPAESSPGNANRINGRGAAAHSPSVTPGEPRTSESVPSASAGSKPAPLAPLPRKAATASEFSKRADREVQGSPGSVDEISPTEERKAATESAGQDRRYGRAEPFTQTVTKTEGDISADPGALAGAGGSPSEKSEANPKEDLTLGGLAPRPSRWRRLRVADLEEAQRNIEAMVQRWNGQVSLRPFENVGAKKLEPRGDALRRSNDKADLKENKSEEEASLAARGNTPQKSVGSTPRRLMVQVSATRQKEMDEFLSRMQEGAVIENRAKGGGWGGGRSKDAAVETGTAKEDQMEVWILDLEPSP